MAKTTAENNSLSVTATLTTDGIKNQVSDAHARRHTDCLLKMAMHIAEEVQSDHDACKDDSALTTIAHRFIEEFLDAQRPYPQQSAFTNPYACLTFARVLFPGILPVTKSATEENAADNSANNAFRIALTALRAVAADKKQTPRGTGALMILYAACITAEALLQADESDAEDTDAAESESHANG